MSILDRYIRYRDAPAYLGMDRGRFDSEVRPTLIEIPIGERGIAFDRLDLDAWADDYKTRNGRPSRKQGAQECEQGQKASKPQRMAVRLSTSNTGASASSPVSAQLARTKRKAGSGKSKQGSMSNLDKALATCSAMRPKGIS
jgi:hypothetical protein